MKTRFAMIALFALLAGPAVAQTIPEGQSCGGLLCDMGVLGSKTSPLPAPAAVAPPPQAATVVPEPIVPEAKPHPIRKKKLIAKSRPKTMPDATVVAAPQATSAPAPTPSAGAQTAKPATSAPAPAFDPDSQPALQNFGIVPIYR